jgi:hypothetical protein
MTDEIAFPSTPFPLGDALILLCRYGSEVYDLVIPGLTSGDSDLMGVAVPPKRYYLGLSQWDNSSAIQGVWDVTIHELRKTVSLLCKQNPTILGLLWTPDEHVLVRSLEGTVLLENRDLFRHERYARDAFCGYARGQLHRMTSFDRDAMERISRLEELLADKGVHLGHAAEGKLKSEPPEVQALVDRYVELRRTHKKAYMGAKRWQVVRRVGYDTKNAAHMLRLLHMGYEYLTTGRIEMRRTWDREMLMQIKRGEWPLAHVQKHADEWFAKVDAAKSVLPASIDMAQVEGLTMSLVESRLGIR